MSKYTHSESLETRNNILRAARKVFADKGFYKSSLSDIAREANVTRGAIYWHFENKNELLTELCMEAAKDAKIAPQLKMAADERCGDPLGVLKSWVLSHFTEDAGELFSSFLVDTVSSLMSSPDTSASIKDAKDRLGDMFTARSIRIETALRNAVVRKQLPEDTDIRLAASMIECTLGGFVCALRHDMAVKPYTRYEKVVDLMFNRLSQVKI